MKAMKSTGLQFDGSSLFLLDQTQLPQNEKWLQINSLETMEEAIKSLRVRGAPLIGVAVAIYLGWALEKKQLTYDELIKQAEVLRASRPTAVNLMNALDRLLIQIKNKSSKQDFLSTVESLFDEDVELCESIGEFGQAVIDDGDGVLTHCNTGGLATVGRGTALGVIQAAHEAGKKIHVNVDETRPLLQGGRLTTWELDKLNIPYSLICDNMAAALMRDGEIQKAIVGADRIAINGDFANKTGTYSVAVGCFAHDIPFYVAAPTTTVDFACSTGHEIPIEQRVESEVRGVSGSFGEVQWAPVNSPVYNPSFDVTPAKFVSGWIFDRGVLSLEDVKCGAIQRLSE